MAYITAEDEEIVYWSELEGVRELERVVAKLTRMGYQNIHMWAVSPSWQNDHFWNLYLHCNDIKEFTINLED